MSFFSLGSGARLGLRAGELVEVRSREEILASLDETGALDGLPFMPEMLAFCGQQFTVAKIAHKTCDTVAHTGLRRMTNTVHLEGTRCTGAAHGGCQAACQIFWKESWLKRAPKAATKPAKRAPLPLAPTAFSEERLFACTTRTPPEGSTETHYRCQATDLLKASAPLANWEPLQHVRDVLSGNVSVIAAVRGIGWWFFRFAQENLRGYNLQLRVLNALQRLRGGAQHVHLGGTLTKTPSEKLGLDAGEMVQVKTEEEIRQTLDPAQKNRGLYFDKEMTPFCGQTYRVRARVKRIIDEPTGRMINLPGDCIMLEGAVCTGKYHLSCPRAIFPYWREIWLRRPPNEELEMGATVETDQAEPVLTDSVR